MKMCGATFVDDDKFFLKKKEPKAKVILYSFSLKIIKRDPNY